MLRIKKNTSRDFLLLHQVWELPEVTNWIILTSVLRKASLSLAAIVPPLYRTCTQVSITASMRKMARIRSLYKDKRRSCYLFDDLHCTFTADGGPLSLPLSRLPEDLKDLKDLLIRSSFSTAGRKLRPPGGVDGAGKAAAAPERTAPSTGALKALVQQLTAANYFLEHLDARVPVVVVSASLAALSPRAPFDHPPARGLLHVAAPDEVFSARVWGYRCPVVSELMDSLMVVRTRLCRGGLQGLRGKDSFS